MKKKRPVSILSLSIVCLCLHILLQCTSPTKPLISAVPTAHQSPDSIFAYFEATADTEPAKYVHNPDSFVNKLDLHPQNTEQNEMYAYGLVFMAYGLREYGDHYNSIRYYEKALNHIRQQQVNEIDIHLYIIKPLAALYILIDDNQKAISLLEEVLHVLPENNHNLRIGFVNNLANAYLYNQDFERAKSLLHENLLLPTNSLSKALLYNTLSSVYEEDRDLKNSTRFNQLAIQEFQKNKLKGDTLIWYSSALGQYGGIYNDEKMVHRGLEILNQNFPDTQFRTKANLQLVLANILYHQKKTSAAQKAYTQVLQTFGILGQEYTLDYKYTQALVGIANCHKLQQRTDSALHYFRWAIENDFRTQQLITSKKNQINNNIWNRAILEEMSAVIEQILNEQPNNNKAIETLLWCTELTKGRLLINEINRSEHWDNASPKLKDAIRHIRQLHQIANRSNDPLKKQSVQRDIDKTMMDFQLSERYFETLNYEPNQTAFLKKLNDNKKDYYSYFIHTDSSISIIGRSNNQYIYRKTKDNKILDSLSAFKKTYFGESPHAFNRSPQQYYKQAKKLADKLLPHIAHTQSNVSLSLDGILYGLPFDALYDTDFLIKKNNFSYLNSFILYDLLKNTSTTETEIALLYREEFPSPLPDLNFVTQEVNNISKNFQSIKISPELQTDSNIVGQFASPHIIHIASHTILDQNQNPIIYLRDPISTEQLRFYHISSPMVFLSACNTGSGKSLPSEGMESIQRVFLGKGVPSVISTYWLANDEAMLQLTALFYHELDKSNNPMQALADAKRLFMAEASLEQQNPWYWANINYTGIGNEIGLKKTSNLPIFILFGLILCTAVLTVRYLRSHASLVKKNKETNNKPH